MTEYYKYPMPAGLEPEGRNRFNGVVRSLNRDGYCDNCSRIIHKHDEEVFVFTSSKSNNSTVVLCSNCLNIMHNMIQKV